MEKLDFDTEVFVDAYTEEGYEFSFQCTKKTDPIYALKPTKRHFEERRWSQTTWVNTKKRLEIPICPSHGKAYALLDS
eukprot:956761-Amphidinium_carterae.1